MISTSAGYNPFPAVRSPDVLVSFEVVPKAASKEDAEISTEASARIGNIGNAINGFADFAGKYATLERYGWPLDGSCVSMPRSGTELGFWTEAVTEADGTFYAPVTVRMELPEPIDTFGWTFHFDAPGGVWASRVRAVWYDAEDNVLGEAEGEPDGSAGTSYGWSLQRFAAEYTAAEFTFYGTAQPLRMLRLCEIDLGISRRFTRDNVQDVRLRYGLSVDASTLPMKELTFTFDNSDGEFNILNPVGVYQYWKNGQVLRAKIKIGDEAVNMGTFTESQAEIGKNRLLVKVRAHDQCYHLARQKYYPDEAMRTAESVTLRAAAEDVLSGYDLKINCNGLDNEPVSCAVKETHYKRTMLRYLAQAARCSVWIDRDNTVQFRRLAVKSAESADGMISPDELYDWSGVSIEEEFTGCVLTVTRELERREGASDADDTGVTYTYTSGVSDDEGVNTASYENPCVAPGQEQAVCDWLLGAANWRKKYAVKNRCDPAAEIGDTLVIADAFRNDDPALVTGLDIQFDGALSCVTEAARELGA